jgi:hypothetical protein
LDKQVFFLGTQVAFPEAAASLQRIRVVAALGF